MKPLLIRLCCLFCVFPLLVHCAHVTPLPPPPLFPSCSPDLILQKIQQDDIPQGLRGIAKVKVELPDKKFSVKEIIIVQNPHYLRLETLSPLGQPQFIAATDGDDLYLFYPSENKFYSGAASRGNLSLFIPLNLSLETVVSLISGRVPLIEYDDEQMACVVEGDFYVLRLSGRKQGRTQTLKLHRDHHELKTESYGEEEELLFTTQYGSYEKVGNVLFPKEIIVTVPHDGTKVRVRYKSVELLSQIDPDKFTLTPPQGVEILTLE